MSKWALAIVGICLILGGCASNNAAVVQANPPEPCKQPPTSQMANQPGFRQLTVRLESGSDAPTKLSQGDLQIRDGNQDIPVQFFQQEPASVGILVDTSGSMEPNMRPVNAALTDLIDGLNPNDQAFLMAFSSRTFVLQPFTNDHVKLKNQLDLLHAFGQTSLCDSIIQGLQAVKHGCYENKALFVMTDGKDNVSSAIPSEMMDAVRTANVPIYALGIGREGASRPLYMGPFRVGADTDKVDVATLRELAEVSSGKFYILPESGDAQAKQTALAIANEIDNEYVIGFIAPPAQNSKIQIELPNHPSATLKIEGAPPDVSVANDSHP